MPLVEHLEKVLIFEKLIQAGSLRKASELLRIGQPALTRTLAILERESGHSLVTRSREGLHLTAAGLQFLNYSRELREKTESLESRLHGDEPDIKGKLVIGTNESLAVYLLPNFLKEIQKRNKNLSIYIKTAHSTRLIEDLRLNRLEFTLSINPSQHKSIVNFRMFEDRFGFFRSPKLSPEDRQTLIVFKEAKDRQGRSVSDYLKSFQMNKLKWIECESFEASKAFAIAELGVAVLPVRVAHPSITNGLLIQTQCSSAPTSFGGHDIELSCLKSRTDDRLLNWVKGELESFLKSQLRSDLGFKL